MISISDYDKINLHDAVYFHGDGGHEAAFAYITSKSRSTRDSGSLETYTLRFMKGTYYSGGFEATRADFTLVPIPEVPMGPGIYYHTSYSTSGEHTDIYTFSNEGKWSWLDPDTNEWQDLSHRYGGEPEYDLSSLKRASF